MSKAVKAAGLGLVIFVTVWVVTLWHWYRSQQPVSSEEAATQLLLLPTVLTIVALFAGWGAMRLRQWSSQPIVAAPAPAPAAAGVLATEGAVAAPLQPLGLVNILAEAVSLPSGDDPALAWAALQSGQARPGLDPRLLDADGMPVFSARVPGLSTADWLDAHAEVCDPTLPESLLRAMALIEAPLHGLMAALPMNVEEGARNAALSMPGQGSSGPLFLSGVGQPDAPAAAARRRDTAPQLDIQVWVPADWAPEHRSLFADWLRQQAGVALDWARAWGSAEPRWSVEALDAPEAGWDRLLPSLHELHTDARPRLLLVLAAQSLVDEAGVSSLQARGELFTAEHQGGRVPGEGAAGLLLANAPMAARCAEAEHPWLGSPVSARRQRSADRSGRPGSDEFTAAMQQVLAPWLSGPDHSAGQAEPAGQAAWWCLSDADHRPGRSSELFEAFQTLQPDGDASQAVLKLGDAWGDLGVARALVPLALAASGVRQGLQLGGNDAQQPVPAVVGLLQCSHRRWAIPVWPPGVGRAAPAVSPQARVSSPTWSPSSSASLAEPQAA